MKLKLSFIIVFCSVIHINFLFSYPNNYQQILTGSRIAAMGGAGCALGGEGEAAFYNPAGIVFTKKDGINLSVSHYGMDFLYESGRENAGDNINKEITHDSGLLIIPAVTTFTAILDKDKANPQFFLNLGLFVPSMTDLEGHEIGSDSNYEHDVHALQSNYIYHIYINFAYRMNNYVALGIALVGNYSKMYQSVNLYRYDKATPANSTYLTESYNYKTIGIGLSLGVIFTLERFRLGITCKTKKIPFYSESSYTFIIPGQEPIQREDMSVDYQRPWEFYFGIAYEIFEGKFVVSFDFKYYPSEEQNVIDTPSFKVKFERLSTWNVNMGIEYKFTEKWSIRSGFFTDRSATPLLNASNNANLRMARIDRYGITLGGGYVSKNTKMNIAVMYVWGFGDIKIQNISSPGTYGIAQAKTREILITIGSAYWFNSSNKEKDKKTNKNKR